MEIFENEKSKILYGDVIDGLNNIPNKSVNLIFADPPYNIGKDFDGFTDSIDESEYIEWSKQWILLCKEKLVDNGTFYLMSSTQNMPYYDIFCREHFFIRSRIIWAYDSSGMQAKNYFGSLYEPILMLVQNKNSYIFNGNDIRIETKTGFQRKLIDYRKTPPRPYNTTKIPGNVWVIPRVRFKMDEYENHPTQKPIKLLERIILASSNKDDIVLDPFSGSFTTSYVAQKLQRRSIGIELNEEYVKMGLRRLNIQSHYLDNDLLKIKKRKTKNLSKNDHNNGE